MEKRGILSFLFIFSFLISEGQDAFIRKDLLVNGSVYLFDYRKQDYTLSERAGRSLPFSVSAEYGINDRFSVGGFAGYYIRRYRFTTGTTEPSDDKFFSSRYLVPGIKASWHFTPCLEKLFDKEFYSEDLDLYLSAMVGFEWNTISRKDVPAEGNSKVVPGLVVGARYYLTERWALFGEVGPGVFGLGSLGATARF